MFGFVAASPREPPTIVRAQNPMALRPMTDGRRWDGQTGIVEARGSGYFCTFASMAYGVRAGAITLRTYMDTHGRRTISGILRRWAPPEDGNDTAAYIRAVAAATGFAPEEPLEWDFETVRKLAAAIIRHECGYAAASADVVAQGLALAGLEAPAEPPRPLSESREMRNGAGGVAVGAGGLLATLIAYKEELLTLLRGAGDAAGAGASALSRSACSPAEWASIFSFLLLSCGAIWFGLRVMAVRLRARQEGLR